ncbi:MAG: hypothetical protein JKY52_07060 [Flavobacteriales bacterium]|nr:hypothetical protein [Flavobacteriales bacterium]
MQRISRHALKNDELRIDLSDYGAGVYLYQVKSNQLKVGSGRIIIEP